MKLYKSATETFDSIAEAYIDTTISSIKWHKAFKECGSGASCDDKRMSKRARKKIQFTKF